MGQISQQVNTLLAAVAGAERIFAVMDAHPETDDGTATLVRVLKDGDTLTETDRRTGHWAWKKSDGSLTELRGDVRFEHVDFGYDPEKTVLHDVSLFAEPGQKIAFVGSTGAGKTTITNLINRFYDIQSGVITYDGIDVRDIRKDSLRRSLGSVLQDTHLFTGTVADNIRYGKLDATDEEVRAAARLANADTFIRHLPQGYDTVITGDGGSLSQGERQLLAIARAAVSDPPVLILDVATSSVDSRTEKLIGRYFPDIRFDVVLGQRPDVPLKPDPAVVGEILTATGVAAGEVLYVGDSGVDMQTAAAAGVRSAGVTWGFRTRAEWEQSGARHIVDRPAELLGLL